MTIASCAVETGCCPHTAIRDDIAPTSMPSSDLEASHPARRSRFVESGGDNLTAHVQPRARRPQIFVLDVAGGDKVPRKGGPGVTTADLLVINKTDLAPLVGADLEVMAARRRSRARTACRSSSRPSSIREEQRPSPCGSPSRVAGALARAPA